jgi:Endoplasmic Reticulum Oxidoreductin 1 (ERO1)
MVTQQQLQYPSVHGTNLENDYHDPLNEFSNKCLDERVLYRLLSGLHSSTTISIAKQYSPPSKKKSVWESNQTYFIQKFNDHIVATSIE